MKTVTELKVVSKGKLKGLIKDAEKSAKIIDLIYVSDKDPGIERIKKGKNFSYIAGEKKITDKDEILRIKKLVIPPAWEQVWICRFPNGHLQATGIDVKKRKQYRYHTLWSRFRNQTKFFHLLEFGKNLPSIREQLEKDLAKPGLPLEKLMAGVVLIMQYTNIRVGNSMYEKLYGSFGLTTMKDKHVTVNGSQIKFCFKGKKGVYHEINLKSRKLANIIRHCREIPGKELFQYYDENGEKRSIDSGMVNEYIKNICEGDFTTKDFRTWTGTAHAIEVLKEMGCCETETETKKNIVEALDKVAQRLGNTRTVCRKYYVHPVILDMYGNKEIEKFFKSPVRDDSDGRLSEAECILLKILQK